MNLKLNERNLNYSHFPDSNQVTQRGFFSYSAHCILKQSESLVIVRMRVTGSAVLGPSKTQSFFLKSSQCHTIHLADGRNNHKTLTLVSSFTDIIHHVHGVASGLAHSGSEVEGFP